MLGRTSSLLFPRLVHIGEANSKKDKTIQLYRLDWSGMENILKERHEKWNEDRKEDLKKDYKEDELKPLSPYDFFDALRGCTERSLSHGRRGEKAV